MPPTQESAAEFGRTFLVPEVPVPPAPWQLQGEAVACFDGRGIALLVNYTASPVGPYHEVARAGFTAGGPKIVRMAVDSPASRRGGRRNWGFPKTLQAIGWQRRGNRIEVRTDGKILRWHAGCGSLPIRLRAFTVQRFHGSDVRVPVEVSGRVRLAWRGRQVGVVLEEMTLFVAAVSAGE